MDSPPTRPVNGGRESSMPVKSSSERRVILTRIAAVDVDDSESQTSSSCPTSSSSTSTTPPGHLTLNVHEAAQHKCTTLPAEIATVRPSGMPSQFQVSVKPVTAMCRVRPLTNIDWRGDGQRQAGMSTSSPETAVPPASGLADHSGDGGPVRRELGHESAITVTPLTKRRCGRPPSNIVARPYDDDCAISVDDILMSDHNVVESKTTVYDNVQQLHV